MVAFSRWLTIGAALGALAALVPLMRGQATVAVNRVAPLGKSVVPEAPVRPAADVSGLNLLRLEYHPRRVTSPLDGERTAELTLNPELQRTVVSVMKRYQLPEAGAVLMDVKSGELLVYASHVRDGVPFDVNLRSDAPAASVFKIVTGAALIEAGLDAETQQCYRGGRSSISRDELREDPKLDRSCASLGVALGRSINVVFGRLAQKHLTPESLMRTAASFGFGAPVPFDVPSEAPRADIPSDPLEFARASAGFWHTTLSPLAGAVLAQTVANGGVALKPRVVRAVLSGDHALWEADPEPVTLRRAISPLGARELTKMMTLSVTDGSAYRAFHHARGQAYLPQIAVAGKTGTLTRHEQNRHYTWFVGFAPADRPEVAVSALVVNTPVWRIKAPDLARDVLRAYFAANGRERVSRP